MGDGMTLVNRMLGRAPNAAGMWKGMVVWPDNSEYAWYHADVQEATNGHTDVRTEEDGPETWTGLLENRDWTKLERRSSQGAQQYKGARRLSERVKLWARFSHTSSGFA